MTCPFKIGTENLSTIQFIPVYRNGSIDGVYDPSQFLLDRTSKFFVIDPFLIIFNIVKFMCIKKVRQLNSFLSFVFLFDPGSEIQDGKKSGSGSHPEPF